MPRPISIRHRLLINLAVVVLALSGTLLAVMLGSTRDTVLYLSSSLTSQSLARTEAQLTQFFEPLKRNLLVAQGWGAEGMLDVDDPMAFRQIFLPFVAQHRHVSSVLLASDDGRELMLRRDDEQWSLRQTRPDDWPGRPVRYRWQDYDGEISTEWRESDYDPRQRPWYQSAVTYAQQHPDARDWVRWTEPYVFFTSQEPGITVVTTFRDPAGKQFVLGFDVALIDLSEFTTQLRIGESGRVVVLTEDNRIVGLPRDERFPDRKSQLNALLQSPDQLGITLARDAAQAFRERTTPNTEPLHFTSDDTAWWAQAAAFPLTEDHALTTVVLIAESELLGKIANTGLWLGLATALTLAWGLWRSRALAQRYSAPIEKLVAQSERMSRGDLTANAPIESSVLEIQQLTDAHDRMREGLQSLMKMERDMQLAREIQQRSFPRVMSILPGYDIAGVASPAEATGGDIYDVIGYCHAPDGGCMLQQNQTAEQALLIVADATGHGIGPALSVTQVRAMLRMAVRANMPLDTMVRHINDQLHSDLYEGRFITAWLGQLSAASHTLRFLSAGQAPLLLLRAAGAECEILDAQGPPLGIVAPYPDTAHCDVALAVDDIFLVVSDGVIDARNAAQQAFGIDRLCPFVLEHRTLTAPELLQALQDEVSTFCAGARQRDDQTILVIKRTT